MVCGLAHILAVPIEVGFMHIPVVSVWMRVGLMVVVALHGTKPATNPDRSSTKTLYTRGTSSLTYSTAGLGPHAEVAPDPDLHAVAA